MYHPLVFNTNVVFGVKAQGNLYTHSLSLIKQNQICRINSQLYYPRARQKVNSHYKLNTKSKI